MQFMIVIALLAIAASIHQSDATTVLVYSIQRHGARNTLPKSIFLKESAAFGGPTLLPEGERLCYNAGLAYRQRYIDPSTCSLNVPSTCIYTSSADARYGVINQGKEFNNYNTWVRASYTDRAILSAQSFFAGIFPANATDVVTNNTGIPSGDQLVPAYTTNDADDWLIRAYTKCNVYDATLANWYTSSVFQDKSQSTQLLRDSVKQISPALDTSLTNWWNVFDGFNTYRTYGVGDPPPAPINDTTWTSIRQLAYWLETAKMKSDLTGNLLGGPLVADLVSMMDAAAAAITGNQKIYYKLLSISSHYNVQLGVLAALALDKYPPAVSALNWLDSQLPQLASVVAFEMHASATSNQGSTKPTFAVRLVVQQGPDAQSYITVPLPCEVAGDAAEQLAGKGSCTWNSFRNLAFPQGLSTAAAWCSACGNTDATPCKLANAQAQLAGIGAPQSSGDTVSKSHYTLAVTLGVVLTFVGTLALSGAFFGYMYYKLKQRPYSAKVAGPTDGPDF